MNDGSYENLKSLMAAIVVQATKDYVTAYKSKDKSKLKALEHFFYSDYFADLTEDSIRPDELMKALRNQANGTFRIHQKRKGDTPKDERIQN